MIWLKNSLKPVSPEEGAVFIRPKVFIVLFEKQSGQVMLKYILQFFASAITEGSIYVLIGLGLVIIHRSTEVMYFAQGTIAMAVGVTLYALFTKGHIPQYWY